MPRVDYPIVLYGLLHDIGKPMLRYKMRVNEGLEKYDEEIMKYLKNVRSHEEILDVVLKEILELNPESYKPYEEVILQSDRMAAAERGLETEYSRIREIWGEIELSLSEKLEVDYKHYKAPMLSPLWLLLKTDYKNSIGPCAKTVFDANNSWAHIHRELKSLRESLSSGDVERVSEEMSRVLKPLMSEPMWYPEIVLSSENLENIRAFSYVDALSRISYYSVTRYLIDTLKLLRKTYGSGLNTRGLINTLLEALKYSLLLVPSAVYLALAPDISLYSHSKLVSAYVAALSSGSKAFKLLLLDARGIQDFISAPVKAKAASRVIRGRSLLVELVTTSLTNYVLELYSGLPNTNVISSEGGSLMLVVPHIDEEDKLVKAIEEVVEDTYKRLKGLWFTIAYSKPFTSRDAGCLSTILGGEDKECFMNILESLENELAEKKSLDNARMRVSIEEEQIVGFDAITLEPVSASEVSDHAYGLKVSEAILDYAGEISGFKLELGEVVGEATHLSLIAGTCSRNMIYLISTYLYETKESIPRPSSMLISRLTEELANELSSESKHVRSQKSRLVYELSETIKDSSYGLLVGLLPLPSLGSLHVLISVKDIISGDYVSISSALIDKILTKVHKALSKVRSGAENKTLTRIDLKIVNVGSEFINAFKLDSLRNHAVNFLKDGIDISLGVFHAGTYHPHKILSKEGVTTLTLVDLDEYPLIGLAKVDGDELGEVKKLLSSSPSRLVTFSDLLSVLLSVKTHLLSSKYPIKSPGLVGRGPIMLYAGGDDVAFYGYWVDIIFFLYEIYKEIIKPLYPLSFTSAIAVDAGDYPILEFYGRVADLLRDTKAEGKGGLVIYPFTSPRIITCDEGCKIVRPVSIWDRQTGWPQLPTSLATLEAIVSVLKVVDSVRLDEYKRDLQLLSTISALSDSELGTLCKDTNQSSSLYQLIRREVMYSYVSKMREDRLSELSKLLGEATKRRVSLLHTAGEDIRLSFTRLVDAKTLLDLILSYLRQGSTPKSSTGS